MLKRLEHIEQRKRSLPRGSCFWFSFSRVRPLWSTAWREPHLLWRADLSSGRSCWLPSFFTV